MNTIGIIGGMGPEATDLLFHKIIKNTPVKCDGDHIPTMIYSNSKIPDRTKAIISGGISPVSEMVKTAVALETMGADILAMPCNTAHYFYDEVAAKVNVEILNMIELTSKYIQNNHKGEKTALFATSGTIQSMIYSDSLKSLGINIIIPSKADIDIVMDVIYNGVKSGNKNINTEKYKAVVKKCRESGINNIILGCTELPILHEMYEFDSSINWIDPMDVLAKECVKKSL